MDKRPCFLLIVLSLAFPVFICAQGIPVPVSPGSATAASTLETRSPTFSWTATANAAGYELVVYLVHRADDPASELKPVFRQVLPAGATSWTPSLDQGLEPGNTYAWAVRAMSQEGGGAWSAACFFKLATAVEVTEVRQAIEVLRRAGTVGDGRGQRDTDAEDLEDDEGGTKLAVTGGPGSQLGPGSGVEIGSDAILIAGNPVVTTASDQDTLGGITCTEGHMIVQTATGWDCAAPTGLPPCGPGDLIHCYSGPQSTIDVGECRVGTRSCNAAGTGFDPCVGEVVPIPEICDDLDNDCNGQTDEVAACPVEHCGTISASETWSFHPGGHEVTCDVVVEGAGSPTLTVEDGVEVRFHASTSLEVGMTQPGGLDVQGLAVGGVEFTSNAPVPAAGDWNGLHLGPSLTSASVDYLTVEYATDAITVLNTGSASVALDGVTMRNGSLFGLDITSSKVGVTNSSIRDNGHDGVWCAANPCLDMFAPFAGNTVTNNGGAPVSLPDGTAVPYLDPSTSYSGNGETAVVLRGATTVSFNGFWQALDVDYRIEGAVEVAGTGALVIDSGARLLFVVGTGLTIDAPGLLAATGAFFGSAGGGFWKGITYASGSAGSLETCEIAEGGDNLLGNVALLGPGIIVTGSTLRDSATYGLNCSGGCASYSPAPTGNSFSGNISGPTN